MTAHCSNLHVIEADNIYLLTSFLQWWNSADSERDQPRNHPRAKDQGQVWTGRVLSCEY